MLELDKDLSDVVAVLAPFRHAPTRDIHFDCSNRSDIKQLIRYLIHQVESVTGTLSNFIVEPFLPHPSNAEYYVCITSQREGDTILFTHEGGVDIGDVDAKALKLDILVGKPFPSRDKIAAALLKHVPTEKQDTLVDFLCRLYSVYVDLHFAYLEINPLVCLDGVDGGQPTIHYLDMAAKLDQTADSICGPKWAIARDLSLYDTSSSRTVTQGKGVSADRGPPMVSRHLALRTIQYIERE